MIRLFGFILVFAVFLTFIVLNLQHRTDISFGFVTFQDVPVFVSTLCAFMFGILFAIPMAFAFSRKKRAANKHSDEAEKSAEESPAADNYLPADLSKENSPYGIN